MISDEEQSRVQVQAAELAEELRSADQVTSGCKNGARVRIRYQFKDASGAYVVALARELRDVHDCRWFSTCLARYHPEAYRSLDDAQVEAFGQGLATKGEVDAYTRILAGPAWLHGLVSDSLIHRWARSGDRWWRRAALVSTVALNVRSADGGTGDTPRTLAVCRMLVDERDEMVVQALSWALRSLVGHDAQAVRDFVHEYEDRLAPRVRREVAAALTSGPKPPSYHSG